MTFSKRLIAVLTLSLLVTSPAHAAPQVGNVVFHTDFEAADDLSRWQGAGQPGIRLEQRTPGSKCLYVERPAEAGPGYRSVRKRLPLEKIRGTRVRVDGLVKAERVADPPNPWSGVKVMLHTVAPGGPKWAQQNGVVGTFDWRPVRFVAEVPSDATEAWLVLGLEQTTGRAWFDDVKITVTGVRRSVPAEKPTGPVYKGHDLPRLRGAMIGPRVTEADLRVLGGAWKANHVRWQLIWGGFPHSPADKVSVEEYRRWLNSALDHLDGLLPVCEELGIMVLIDLHTPPGGRNQAKECRMFKEQRFQKAFVDLWEMIARRYRGKKAVWGYDLVNEPVEGILPDGLMDWHALATATARKVRQIDPDHAIIIEPGRWGSPQGLEWFEPLDVPGIVYSVHMYAPHQFTHQGIYGNPAGIGYPGKVNGKYWDKEALRRALKPAIDYQQDHGVHIYLGEFSAIRWAPGDSANNYLHDCIEIFEENGWDWAYHAFREWDGWSVEHGPDRKDRSPSPTPTKRENLLRSWFEKNHRKNGQNTHP